MLTCLRIFKKTSASHFLILTCLLLLILFADSYTDFVADYDKKPNTPLRNEPSFLMAGDQPNCKPQGADTSIGCGGRYGNPNLTPSGSRAILFLLDPDLIPWVGPPSGLVFRGPGLTFAVLAYPGLRKAPIFPFTTPSCRPFPMKKP